MNSIWTDTTELPRFPALKNDIQTDVLIIGGGIAGLLCAYFLQKHGVNYLLAERDRICSGITANTTAKITAQHGLIYAKLLKNAGPEKAGCYLEANQKAVETYFELCRSIDCDFEEKTSYVYSLNDRAKLEDEVRALRQLGCSCELTKTNELPFPTAGAAAWKHQAQFHPLKFLSQIARSLHIYERTFVKELSEHTAVTEQGRISYQKLIFATHFPMDNKHGLYFLKLYQHRSYVLALSHPQPMQGMYVDEDTRGLSLRSYGDVLLLGGGSHRTGKKGGNWQELRKFAAEYYPQAEEQAHWAAQDCMSLDLVPYIGLYSPRMPDCYVASGFNKWGITSSMAAAEMLTDLVLGKPSPYAAVFSPSRSMWKPQLLLNGLEAAAGLLSFSAKRCPHLGCALKWNAQEHTWDCSCHGSRFTQDGRLLDNPANGDLK